MIPHRFIRTPARIVNEMSLRQKVMDHVMMADRVADCSICGVWWLLSSYWWLRLTKNDTFGVLEWFWVKVPFKNNALQHMNVYQNNSTLPCIPFVSIISNISSITDIISHFRAVLCWWISGNKLYEWRWSGNNKSTVWQSDWQVSMGRNQLQQYCFGMVSAKMISLVVRQ